MSVLLSYLLLVDNIFDCNVCVCVCVCVSLAKLETLELRENLLRYLPSSISRLVKLRSLDLGDNMLEELVSMCR